jgi:predicted nucleotidyltransferase
VNEEDPVPQALALLLLQLRQPREAATPRRVDGVWLFGSCARGTATSESDIDLAVLCEPALELARVRLMDSLGRALSRNVDLIDLATAPPTLTWEVLTTGRLLFVDNAPRVEEFLRRARFAAEDAEQRDRMVLLAQIDGLGASG